MKNFSLVFLSLILLLSAASCGRKAPPSPPKMKLELVLDIFDSLKRSDHKAVIAKIERLKAIDPTDVFLSEFEGIERANLLLGKAQDALMRNDRKLAEESVNEALRQVGNVPNLVQASADIRNLAEMERLAELIVNPLNSAALQEDISEFRTIAAKFKNNKRLLAFADHHERRIPILRFREHKIILYSMEADMLFFEKKEPDVLLCLDSEKIVEQNAFR